ncbi:MAG: ribosomal-processing cysteine protease Prp [Bacilli bacterium]|nr:ribosomal-processing cysteine protease Prp [Bacilli bacterium]
MTTVQFFKTENITKGFQASGHSGYAESGSDIVCSSITTAIFTSLNLLLRYLKKDQYSFIESDGHLSFIIKETVDLDSVTWELSQNVFDNLYDILKNVESDYPKFLKVK